MRNKLLKLPSIQKRSLILGFDALLLWVALFLAFSVRVGIEEVLSDYLKPFLTLCVLTPLIVLPTYQFMGLYSAVLRHMGPQVSLLILRASLVSCFLLTAVIYWFDFDGVPKSIPVTFLLFSGLLLGVSRYAVRYWLTGFTFKDILLNTIIPQKKSGRSHQGIPVAVYGAGDAGTQLAIALNRSREYRPVAFIDDNAAMVGRTLAGRRIYLPTQLAKLIAETRAEEILLAIPSVKKQRRTEIVQQLESFGLPIKTMPGMRDLASGRLKLQDVQDVDVGDVLGREEVKPIPELIEKHITDKVVMVTGAGGSIGSEMVRQALLRKPKALILFEHSEFNLYAIDQELQKSTRVAGATTKIVAVLGSINNDPSRMLDVMRTYKVETLYHAAAYKHVPIVQYNVSQGLRNNVLGTLFTAQAAIAAGVKNFVLISTDKAVRPTNVMGASKRLAEMVLQALSCEKEVDFYQPELFGLEQGQSVINKTHFTMVRFGNVLGSSGSVIPVFREQIRTGGPITVTHPEINRYFMTIPEAAQLVIQAGAMGQAGDVFVLEMGEPVKIVDLAKRMISLSGLTFKDDQNPDGDIEIAFSGLRPGEKLYEELLIGDNATDTEHPRICRASEEMLPWYELKQVLDQILSTLHEHRYKITRELLLRYVNGYKPSSKVVDWLYKQSDHQAVENEIA